MNDATVYSRADMARAWDDGWRQGASDVEYNGWEPHDLMKGRHPVNPHADNAAPSDAAHSEPDATLTEGDVEEMIAHTATRDDLIAALRQGFDCQGSQGGTA